VLTLAMERADGIEKIGLRCRVADTVGAGADEAAAIEAALERLAPWIERDFERTREEALKSIRSERRLLEIEFRDP
jgi:ectoine hydroxylase-related dioxygenase (phytanoyl-CoA dioxygenase family)